MQKNLFHPENNDRIGKIIYHQQLTNEGYSYYIELFYINKKYRGKGYFNKMINTMMNIGRRYKIYIFYLRIASRESDENYLLNLYQKYGFIGNKELMRLNIEVN